MPFVQFVPQGQEKKIQATLTAKGLLSLSVDAVKEFGLENSTHVLLFFDSERRMLGLRGASADTPGALKLARRKRVVSLQIAPLLQHYRLIVPGKLIMEPQFDEETKLVVVQLLGARKRPGRQPRLPWAKLPRRAASRSAAVGTRRGRPPKAAAAPPASRTRRGRPPAETPAPAKRRGRPPKAVGESSPAEPRRRGRPRKAEGAP